MINIRKYGNRKFYISRKMVGAARYVTLKEIAALIQEGHDIKVTCWRTKNDITRDVLNKVLTLVDFEISDTLKLLRGENARENQALTESH